MAEAEQPERLRRDREVTVDDIRQLVASATPHFSQKAASGYGSYASTFISKPEARCATPRPIRPSPTIPSVLRQTSRPGGLVQVPDLTILSFSTVRRASEKISAKA